MVSSWHHGSTSQGRAAGCRKATHKDITNTRTHTKCSSYQLLDNIHLLDGALASWVAAQMPSLPALIKKTQPRYRSRTHGTNRATRGRLIVANRCRGRIPEPVMVSSWLTHGRHRVSRTQTRACHGNPWSTYGRHWVPRTRTRACHGEPVVDSWSPPGAADADQSLSW